VWALRSFPIKAESRLFPGKGRKGRRRTAHLIRIRPSEEVSQGEDLNL
jgi:hypothetical protein